MKTRFKIFTLILGAAVMVQRQTPAVGLTSQTVIYYPVFLLM